MGETIRLKAADGHELDAYVAYPTTKPIAGLVVIQEIFGVNRHFVPSWMGTRRTVFLPSLPRYSTASREVSNLRMKVPTHKKA